jgi:hypothetical protein
VRAECLRVMAPASLQRCAEETLRALEDQLARAQWEESAETAQREALGARASPRGELSRYTAEWDWGEETGTILPEQALGRQVYWCTLTLEMVLEPYTRMEGVDYANVAISWDEVGRKLEKGAGIKLKASTAKKKASVQYRKPPQLPTPRSNFSLLITPLPCFEHGIGELSYSQICSRPQGSEETARFEGLAVALSSLQASERWKAGLGEP